MPASEKNVAVEGSLANRIRTNSEKLEITSNGFAENTFYIDTNYSTFVTGVGLAVLSLDLYFINIPPDSDILIGSVTKWPNHNVYVRSVSSVSQVIGVYVQSGGNVRAQTYGNSGRIHVACQLIYKISN